jgi:hypothetical protein
LKSAGGGGVVEFGMNIQHPTSNIQRPMASPMRQLVGCSLLDVGCWMFLLFILSALPAFAQPANEPPKLVPAYGEISPTFWEVYGTLIIIGGFAFIAFVALVLWSMLKPKPTIALPPEVLAREALTKRLRQPENGKLLSEVSQILRRYIVASFELPAAELTTAEFCAVLATNAKVGAELAQVISNFLRECDARKFSPAAVATPFNAVEHACELVKRIQQETTKT